MLEPDQRIARYRLIKRLGSGALGEVWKATDGTQDVAMKFINTEQKHYIRWLENEIRALERLADNPHVPMLYGYDLHFERPYLVMQYISSPSYSRLLTTGEMMTILIETRLDLLNVVAEVIMRIHQKGIIHRDIKPSNINGIDKPYLLDFSIAVDKRHAQFADQNVGTGLYMPPPDHHPPDELYDSYSFALVAYEVIFGQHPIFTPENLGKTLLENRQLARTYIRERKWRLPSRLSPAELPGNLKGADLAAMDDIFQRALGERETRYRDLSRLVFELRSAIVVPKNWAYLRYQPEAVARAIIPAEEDFTWHEFHRAQHKTDMNVPWNPRAAVSKPRRHYAWWVVLAMLLYVLTSVIIGVLVLSGRI